MLTVGSLFSGIGGFDLGLERAGMRVIWQSEIDPYANAVLRKHWPNIPNHGDVRTISAGRVERPDVICGGFPCQDISNAGKRAGITGAQSGLWSEFARIVRELRPQFVVVENVPALLNRGMGRVCGDLAALGFYIEWECIAAAAVGADHVRERLWIVADAGHRNGEIFRFPQLRRIERESRRFPDRRAVVWQFPNLPASCETWASEPGLGRLVDGIPGRVDRLRCLGNAIVPQIAEIIGRAIVERYQMSATA